MDAELFTPNVFKGVADERYRLYRHNRGNMVSITPDGEKFEVVIESDTCGLARCNCGAHVKALTKIGAKLLATAETF